MSASFLSISPELHNALVVLSLCILFGYLLNWIGRMKSLLKYIRIMERNNDYNILRLESNVLNSLRNLLYKVHDSINIAPQQIRRILRQALDENIVKKVDKSMVDLHIKPTIQVSYNFTHKCPVFIPILHKHCSNCVKMDFSNSIKMVESFPILRCASANLV